MATLDGERDDALSRCVWVHAVSLGQAQWHCSEWLGDQNLGQRPWAMAEGRKGSLRRESQTQGSSRRLYSSSISTNAGQGLHPAAPKPDSLCSSPVTGYNSAVHMEGINTSLEYYIIICYL